jgi:hypothetical protein
MQNKPNSANATRRASSLWIKSYDEFDTQSALEKQSQLAGEFQVSSFKFEAREVSTWPGNFPRPGGGTELYKQTQFAADGQGRPSPRPRALMLPPIGGQMRKTKPICAPRIAPGGPGPEGRGCVVPCPRGRVPLPRESGGDAQPTTRGYRAKRSQLAGSG